MDDEHFGGTERGHQHDHAIHRRSAHDSRSAEMICMIYDMRFLLVCIGPAANGIASVRVYLSGEVHSFGLPFGLGGPKSVAFVWQHLTVARSPAVIWYQILSDAQARANPDDNPSSLRYSKF